MGKYFGTDGFRGKAGEGLTAAHAYEIGRFLGWYYGRTERARIVVGKDTRRSSYMLEDVVTEFDIQGLELDYAVVAWDADYRYVDGEWTFNNFVGNRWINVSSGERRLYLKNAYRVLLTRARACMVICVPTGNPNKTVSGFWEDSTRLPEFYDGTYQYLKTLGIEEI